mmetsp:Transcript_24636/g.27423  ORF Transcript_24636/g.27423 Transcript_24636/m.27423 type:complete len:144 (+) Transcript_24636:91-522(+)
MAAVSCTIGDDVRAKIQEICDDETKNNVAIIVKCNLKTKTLVEDEYLTDASIEDLADELSGTCLIVYRRHRPGHYNNPSSVLLIWFNEMSTRADIKRSYQEMVQKMERQFKGLKAFQLSDPDDFTDDWVQTRAFGMTGKSVPA